MAGGSYTQLRGFYSITDLTFSETIVQNLSAFFDWALLNIGGFVDAKIGVSNKVNLTAADIPNVTKGKVWESTRGNWVWESGINYSRHPIAISGVYVNGSLNTSGFYINYPKGQVVFNNPIPASSQVQVEHSYKLYSFYNADTEWFREVVIDPVDEETLTSVLAQNRIYLPAVIVELAPTRTLEGYELGDYTMNMRQTVLFHILADRPSDRNKIFDYITLQYNRTLPLYNSNAVADANKFPLNQFGYPNPNPLNYPDLVDNYRWKTIVFQDMRGQEITSQLKLFRAVIRSNIQVYVP